MNADDRTLGSLTAERDLLLLNKLYFTDLINASVDATPAGDDDEHDDLNRQLVYRVTVNSQRLQAAGATGPVYGVSGFETSPEDERKGFRQFPKLLHSGLEFGLVYWGSPHFADYDTDKCHGGSFKEDPSQFKTNCFESIAWLAPRAFVMITFDAKYKLEFWHPLYKKSDGRDLIVTKAYTRGYRPTASGRHFARLGGHTTMVAMLVPYNMRGLVTYKDDVGCDIGITLFNIIKHLGCNQRAIELGGQDFGLSREIMIASHRADAPMDIDVAGVLEQPGRD